jgi:CheY-like chemotaxis protein
MNKILIIEDERETRDMFLEALTDEGFEAIGAENGRVGLQKTQEYLPDLIICDVTMPELNGYQVLTSLRQNQMTAAIPFIFLTAKIDQCQQEKAMDLGADEYITKPCTVEQLLQAIAQFSNHRQL